MSAKLLPSDGQPPIQPHFAFEERLTFVEATTREIRDDVRDIKTALVGNSELKQQGFADRLQAVEESDKEQNKRLFAWGAVVTGIGTALSSLKDWLSK